MTTGSVVGLAQNSLVAGFRPTIMIVDGDPDNIVLAVSGTFARDFVNDTQYINDSAGIGAGSEWTALT